MRMRWYQSILSINTDSKIRMPFNSWYYLLAEVKETIDEIN